jgi:hypothetical protein
MDPNTSAWDVILHYWPAALFVPSIFLLIGSKHSGLQGLSVV